MKSLNVFAALVLAISALSAPAADACSLALTIGNDFIPGTQAQVPLNAVVSIVDATGADSISLQKEGESESVTVSLAAPHDQRINLQQASLDGLLEAGATYTLTVGPTGDDGVDDTEPVTFTVGEGVDEEPPPLEAQPSVRTELLIPDGNSCLPSEGGYYVYVTPPPQTDEGGGVSGYYLRGPSDDGLVLTDAMTERSDKTELVAFVRGGSFGETVQLELVAFDLSGNESAPLTVEVVLGLDGGCAQTAKSDVGLFAGVLAGLSAFARRRARRRR